jgi:hypothetical protein
VTSPDGPLEPDGSPPCTRQTGDVTVVTKGLDSVYVHDDSGTMVSLTTLDFGAGQVTVSVPACGTITVGNPGRWLTITDLEPGDTIRIPRESVPESRNLSIDFVPFADHYTLRSSGGNCRAENITSSPIEFPLDGRCRGTDTTVSFILEAFDVANTFVGYAVLEDLPFGDASTPITGSITEWRADLTTYTVSATNAPFATTSARADLYPDGSFVFSNAPADMLPDFGDHVGFVAGSTRDEFGIRVDALDLVQKPAPTTYVIDLAEVAFHLESVRFSIGTRELSWTTASPPPTEAAFYACVGPGMNGQHCVVGDARRTSAVFPGVSSLLAERPPVVIINQVKGASYADQRRDPLRYIHNPRDHDTRRTSTTNVIPAL